MLNSRLLFRCIIPTQEGSSEKNSRFAIVRHDPLRTLQI